MGYFREGAKEKVSAEGKKEARKEIAKVRHASKLMNSSHPHSLCTDKIERSHRAPATYIPPFIKKTCLYTPKRLSTKA